MNDGLHAGDPLTVKTDVDRVGHIVGVSVNGVRFRAPAKSTAEGPRELAAKEVWFHGPHLADVLRAAADWIEGAPGETVGLNLSHSYCTAEGYDTVPELDPDAARRWHLLVAQSAI